MKTRKQRKYYRLNGFRAGKCKGILDLPYVCFVLENGEWQVIASGTYIADCVREGFVVTKEVAKITAKYRPEKISMWAISMADAEGVRDHLNEAYRAQPKFQFKSMAVEL